MGRLVTGAPVSMGTATEVSEGLSISNWTGTMGRRAHVSMVAATVANEDVQESV